MKRIVVTVDQTHAGERLDKFLAAQSGLSRGACRRALTEGGVWLDRKRVRRLSLPVEAGWVLEIVLDEPSDDVAPPTVLHEDAAILVVAKPPGLPTQGTLASDRRSVLGWAEQGRRATLRTVHRLDIGTSGVLVLAKTAAAATALAEQFREGTVAKVYLALGVGGLPAESGELTGRLQKATRLGSYEVATGTRGIPAHTDYRVLGRKGSLLLIEARPRTGRTHQIRVHLAGAGAPLLGDSRYGGPPELKLGAALFQFSRPLLHAASLSFNHPVTGTRTIFETPPPADFAEVAGLVKP